MSVERHLVPIDRQEALRLLGSASFGRVVFTSHALPAIRPVNHLVDDGAVIIRTHLGSAIGTLLNPAEPGVVVAYEADEISAEDRLGWSVVVTGVAQAVTDAEEAAGYEKRLQPWISQPMDQVIRIVPDLVTGFRLAERAADGAVDAAGGSAATSGDAPSHAGRS